MRTLRLTLLARALRAQAGRRGNCPEQSGSAVASLAAHAGLGLLCWPHPHLELPGGPEWDGWAPGNGPWHCFPLFLSLRKKADVARAAVCLPHASSFTSNSLTDHNSYYVCLRGWTSTLRMTNNRAECPQPTVPCAQCSGIRSGKAVCQLSSGRP